jgi:serine/threonine protein kinase
MIKIKLKGGSLSATSLCDVNGVKFIRKEVSTKENREYGFGRWYSQLKKLQRMGNDFPELIPKVLNVSVGDDTAYFDIEYLEGYVDLKSLLCEYPLTLTQIFSIADKVVESLSTLHKKTYSANPNAAKLYYTEEVKQKLIAATANPAFANFYDYMIFEYNNEEVGSILEYLPKLEQFFSTFNVATECYVHGNPTLENIMYSPSTGDIKFIDLYEEGIIDCKELDFSQVLQCSHSHYGYLNDRHINVEGAKVWHDLTIPPALLDFNIVFENKLKEFDMQALHIFEATQFIRMLPFKCAVGEINKAKFFYVHACYLLGKCFNE